MTETIEQAAERIFNISEEKKGDVFFGSYIAHLRKGFKFGANWQLSQPNPHRIKEWQLVQLNELYLTDKITHSRMVKILNEIAAGKHKERIEL